MGALPKHKVSRHQRGNRRRHQVLKPPVMVNCPNCGAQMQMHRVCKECGQYKGRQIIQTKKRDDDES